MRSRTLDFERHLLRSGKEFIRLDAERAELPLQSERENEPALARIAAKCTTLHDHLSLQRRTFKERSYRKLYRNEIDKRLGDKRIRELRATLIRRLKDEIMPTVRELLTSIRDLSARCKTGDDAKRKKSNEKRTHTTRAKRNSREIPRRDAGKGRAAGPRRDRQRDRKRNA